MSLVQDESTDSYFLGLDLIETGNAKKCMHVLVL